MNINVIKKNIKLIPEWKKSWKFASVQWSVFGAAILVIGETGVQVLGFLPPEIKDSLPNLNHITLFCFVCVMIGRILKVEQTDEAN